MSPEFFNCSKKSAIIKELIYENTFNQNRRDDASFG